MPDTAKLWIATIALAVGLADVHSFSHALAPRAISREAGLPFAMAPCWVLRDVRMSAPTAAGSPSRGLDIFYELASRAGLGIGPRVTTPILQREILEALAPHGDPAQRVPASVAERVDALCEQLEARSPVSKPATRGIQALEGRWRVRYSNAPPPSNGALGPFVGEAYQLVNVDSQTYSNQLVSIGPPFLEPGLQSSSAISSLAHPRQHSGMQRTHFPFAPAVSPLSRALGHPFPSVSLRHPTLPPRSRDASPARFAPPTAFRRRCCSAVCST